MYKKNSNQQLNGFHLCFAMVDSRTAFAAGKLSFFSPPHLWLSHGCSPQQGPYGPSTEKPGTSNIFDMPVSIQMLRGTPRQSVWNTPKNSHPRSSSWLSSGWALYALPVKTYAASCGALAVVWTTVALSTHICTPDAAKKWGGFQS